MFQTEAEVVRASGEIVMVETETALLMRDGTSGLQPVIQVHVEIGDFIHAGVQFAGDHHILRVHAFRESHAVP